MLYALADRLHKTHDQITAMTLEEVDGWLAYFNLTGDEQWQQAIKLRS